MEPKSEPNLDGVRSYITLTEKQRVVINTDGTEFERAVYEARWRGVKAIGETVPEVMQSLSEKIEDTSD